MHLKTKQGFTLIELLVVMSIVSLMASIVYSSLNTGRDKAQVAAGQQLDGQVFRSLGADAVFDYEFEDATTPPANTSPNFAQPGMTITCPFSSGTVAPTPGASGSGINGSRAFSFAATSNCGSAGTFTYQGFNPNAGAFSFWIYPTAEGTIGYVLDSAGTWYSLSGGKIINLLGLSGNSTVSLNKWTHVLVSWSGPDSAKVRKLYINGKLDASSSAAYTFTASGSTPPYTYWFSLGGNGSGGFVGKLDRVILYNQTI